MNRCKLCSKIGRLALIFILGIILTACLIRPLDRDVDLHRLLPRDEDIAGWYHHTEPQVYHSQNLWDYIDGAADKFLDYGFIKLLHSEFVLAHAPKLSLSGQKEQLTLTVDIYYMRDEESGFGIYGIERDPDYQFLPIGTEAYRDELTLNFFQGPYYIKLFTYSWDERCQQALTQFALNIAKKIAAPRAFPEELSYFPRERLVPHSERLQAHTTLNGLTHEKLKWVYTGEVKINETTTATAFLIEPAWAQEDFAILKEAFMNLPHKITKDEQGNVSEGWFKNYKGFTLLKFNEDYLTGITPVEDLNLGRKIIGDFFSAGR